MRICETCGKEFLNYIIIDGERISFSRKRKNCLDCSPYHTKINKNEKRVCKICKKSIKYRLICDTCLGKKNRLVKKLKAIDYFGGKCSRCGASVHPSAFEFHHAFGEKNFQISDSTMKTWKKIKEELVHCELLCSNCHSINHSTYDEEFIKLALETMERVDNFVIENYEFIKDLNKEINPLTE